MVQLLQEQAPSNVNMMFSVTNQGYRPGRYDKPITELSASLSDEFFARVGSWFASYAFSTLYADNPATRALFWVDDAGSITRMLFYNESRWLGCWKALQLFGPVQLSNYEMQELLTERKAQLAVMHRLGEQEIAGLRPSWKYGAVKRVVEDYVIDFPDTSEAYLASLGTRTRQQTLQHMRRLQREWGDELHIDFAVNDEIAGTAVAELVELNRTRCLKKGARHLWTENLLQRRCQYAQRCGFICTVRRGDTLVSGTLTYLHEQEGYTAVVGHDLEFEKLNVGKVAFWLTFERLIKMGITREHLLWGGSPYKIRFGAVENKLYDVMTFHTLPVAICWHLLWALGQIGPWLKSLTVGLFGCNLLHSLRKELRKSLSQSAEVGRGWANRGGRIMVSVMPRTPVPAPHGQPNWERYLSEGQYDCALAELPPEIHAKLRELEGEWLCSYAFSILFFESMATRVSFQVDARGEITHARYYYEQERGRGGRTLHLFGPLQITQEEIRELLRARQADFATLHRMRGQELASHRHSWYRSAIYRNGEDFLATLPSTATECLVALGQKLRKRLPNYTRRIQREFGDAYRVIFAEKEDITLDMVKQLTALNTERSLRKGLKPMWSERLIELRWQLAREEGLFCGIMKGDELVGGTLNYLHRQEAGLAIIAHNPAYDYLHAGYVALWLSTERLIEMGIRHYHYLWGRLRYKTDFGGEYVKFYDLTVFANPLCAGRWYLRNAVPMLRATVHAFIHDRLKDEQLEKFRQFKRALTRRA